MYAQLDKKHKTINFFYSDDVWIEELSYEDTALFIADVTKLLGDLKRKI